MLRVRCSPTEYRIWQRGYGRDAIPSYICAHLCHLWEVLLCQKFPCVPCVLWESLSSHGFHRFTQMLRVRFVPTESTESTEFGSVGMAGMPYPPTSVNIRVISGNFFLCKRFCVFGVFRGSFFTACSVGAAETAAPPGVIHGSSAHISPPHHLTTTTSFHLEPSLLHVLPVLWVRLRHHLRLVDAQPGEHDGSRCERHRHAVVVVGVDRL